MRSFRALPAVLFMMLAAIVPIPMAVQAQTAPADLRGIYVYTNDVSQITTGTANQLTASLNVTGVDGIALVVGWDAIEPAMGEYQWTLLDQWMSEAISLGKKIDLVVPAGASTPSWLFQTAPSGAGATPLNFTVSPHAGETGVCDAVTIAAPWDPAFLSQWDSMLAALSAHLKSAGTYDAVTLLRLTGINRTTEELRLPAETAASTGLACVSNSIATWQQAGYRPSLLLQGWNTVLGSFMKSFPDKSLAVSIIPNDAFPGIAEDGSVIPGHIGDENQPLLMSASQQLSGRLVVQFDFLMPGEAASTEVTDAAQNLGTLAAFQTNEYLGNQGAGCSEPVTSAVPCTASTFLTMLETGIYPLGQSDPLRSQYIEVFHANAAAFPADIQQAHLELTCNYALSIGGQAFTSQGGMGAITITTGAGCPWTVGIPPPGVSLTSGNSGTGTGTVTFQVFPNSGGDVSNTFTVAGQTFTVDQAAASISGLSPIGSLAQVASEGTWDFTLNAVNLGPSRADARFNFFADPAGAPLALPLTFPQLPLGPGPEIASTLDRAINPNAVLAIDSSGPTSAVALIGWSQLLSTGNVGGFGIFSNPVQNWNAVVPLETRNTSSYLLAFDNTGTLTTGVAIANLTAQTAIVPVIIRDGTGAAVSNPQVQLAGMGHAYFLLDQQYPGFTSNRRGTIEFDSPLGGQISVLGLRANGPALTTLPVLANVGTAGGTIAHSTYNGGFTSTYYLVNAGIAAASFTLSFFDESGNPQQVPLSLPQSGSTVTTSALTQTLAAGALREIDTQALDALPLVQGSAQLTTTGAISGFEIFRWTTFGQEASVPIETRNPASFVLIFDNTNGLTTGLALANVTNQAASVVVNLRDDTGVLMLNTVMNVPARGHTAFMLPNNYPVADGKRGTVEFLTPSGGQISVIGVRATPTGILTTIPVMSR